MAGQGAYPGSAAIGWTYHESCPTRVIRLVFRDDVRPSVIEDNHSY